MKISINLASEPFRRDRPILAASVACCVLLLALLGSLVFLIMNDRARLGDTRAAVAKLNLDSRNLAAEQAKLDATLRQPANAEVLQRSLLLNNLVERKSISWTRLFSDLATVEPNNVQVIQVRLPQINSLNEVTLDMQVGAKSPEPVIEFLKNLEASPLFGPAENPQYAPPSQNEPLHRYRISVSYAQKL